MEPTQTHDLLIIGGGAAGYSAAIYARRYNLTVGIIEGKELGGYTALAGTIENYPGVRNADGYALMETMRKQAVEDLGAVAIAGEATSVQGEQHCFALTVAEGQQSSATSRQYRAKALIIATGMEHRSLGLPREAEYRQRGVHFCATCDGPVYTGKPVAVVGGGDSAVKSAVQLADMGVAHVTLIVREDNVDRAEPVNRDRLAERVAAGKVTVLYGTEVVEYLGGPPLEGVRLRRGEGVVSPPPSWRGRSRGGGTGEPTILVAGANAVGTPSSSPSMGGGETETLPLSAVFLSVGAIPRTALAAQLGVRLTPKGEIDVESETMKTNVDGVYAAGDVCDAAWGFKQTVTSAAQGAIAATSVYRDLSEHGGLACPMHAMVVPPPSLPTTLP